MNIIPDKLAESLMFEQMADIREEEIANGNNGVLTGIPVGTLITDIGRKHIEIATVKQFEPYLELFNLDKHPDRKSFTSSGFGFGMGRLIQSLLGSTRVVVC